MFNFRKTAAVATLLTAAALLAQTDRANLTGAVKDQSGAIVPGATVTAIHVATNDIHIVLLFILCCYSYSVVIPIVLLFIKCCYSYCVVIHKVLLFIHRHQLQLVHRRLLVHYPDLLLV